MRPLTRPAAAAFAAMLLAAACAPAAGPDERGPAASLAPGSPTAGAASATSSVRPSPSRGATSSASASASPSASASANLSPASHAPATSAPGAPQPEEPPAEGQLPTYTVAPGDTLSAIASRFGLRVAELVAWNSARYASLSSNPNALQVGWVLVLGGTPLPADPPAQPPPPAQPAPTPPPVAAQPPAPAPAPSGCWAGHPSAAGGQQVFATIPGAGAEVALTFDMGGRIEPAVAIMTFLVENGVCATLFPTGAMSQTPEGQQVLAIVAAYPELFELGNHTMHHCNLRDGGGGSPSSAPCAGGRPSAATIVEELLDAEAILLSGTGLDPAPYWRPPYGAYDQAVLDAAAAAGYTATFMWDIDTVDWKPVAEGGPSAEQIAGTVVGRAVDGSNVLMHLGGYNTLDALRIMVPALRERGFTVTSLSDLLDGR